MEEFDIQKKKTCPNLEERFTALEERVETLEWVMKSVLNKLQNMDPITGGSSHVEAPGKGFGLDNKYSRSREKQKTNPQI